MTLDSVLAAEGADVAGVLGDFHLLDLLTERGTITGSVLAGDADLLGALGHFVGMCVVLLYASAFVSHCLKIHQSQPQYNPRFCKYSCVATIASRFDIFQLRGEGG